jgi:sugar phosphate permease
MGKQILCQLEKQIFNAIIMTLPKEKKQARFMMHVNVIIGALCIIFFVMSIAMKLWLMAVCMAVCGVAQYFSYKGWQKKA